MQTALSCDTFCQRSSPTFQRESTPNIKFWKAVNKRREVCLVPKIKRNRRTSRELARALFDTHELWVKGTDWNVATPGDDPLVVSMIGIWSVPVPRLVMAHISLEGICSYRKYTVEAWDYRGNDSGWITYPRYLIQRKSLNKTGTISQKINTTRFRAGMQAGHGLQVNDIVDITWNGGSRNTVKVVEVASNVVTFDEGSGFPLPNVNTFIVAIRNPVTGGMSTYQWRHLNNPDEWGVDRVLGRMKHLTIVRSWRPQTAQKVERKARDQQGKDQFPGEWVRVSPNTNLMAASYRVPAVRFSQFHNMQTGASLSAIMRKIPMTQDYENPNPPEQGMMMDFIFGLNIVRALYVNGIKWPGIQYGIQNPDVVFESDGDWWIPSPDNEETNFPYIGVGVVENYLQGSTTSPIPTNWMREALKVFNAEFQGNYGEGYVETQFNDLAMGFLETRSNANTGTIHCQKHPFLMAGTIPHLTWEWDGESGERSNVLITITGPNTLTISGGTGDDLPPVGVWMELYGMGHPLVPMNYFSESFGASIAISDRHVYHSTIGGAQINDFAIFGSGTGSRSNIYWTYPGLDKPATTSEGLVNASPVFTVNPTGGQHGAGSQFFFVHEFGFTPIWVEDSARQEYVDENFSPVDHVGNASVIWMTDDTLWAAPEYQTAQGFGWTPPDHYERLSANVGAFVFQANFQTGWENVLSQYEILSSQPISDRENTYDWLKRDASVGASGFGYTNVDFTNPVFAKYGGTVMAWRSRCGNTTASRYGADVFANSVKTYQFWDSLLYPGGLTISGPTQLIQHTIVTYEDIVETAINEVLPMGQQFAIIEWENGAFTQDVQALHPETVPNNYIGNGLADIQVGRLFGVMSRYKEYYNFFVTHDFSLDN